MRTRLLLQFLNDFFFNLSDNELWHISSFDSAINASTNSRKEKRKIARASKRQEKARC